MTRVKTGDTSSRYISSLETSSRTSTQLIYLGSTFAGLLYTRGIGECRSLRQGKHLCYQDIEGIPACR